MIFARDTGLISPSFFLCITHHSLLFSSLSLSLSLPLSPSLSLFLSSLLFEWLVSERVSGGGASSCYFVLHLLSSLEKLSCSQQKEPEAQLEEVIKVSAMTSTLELPISHSVSFFYLWFSLLFFPFLSFSCVFVLYCCIVLYCIVCIVLYCIIVLFCIALYCE